MGVDQQCGAIALVVFRQVGIGIVEIWNLELANAGEKHRWPCKFNDLAL